jgi:hypothetical protein
LVGSESILDFRVHLDLQVLFNCVLIIGVGNQDDSVDSHSLFLGEEEHRLLIKGCVLNILEILSNLLMKISWESRIILSIDSDKVSIIGEMTPIQSTG